MMNLKEAIKARAEVVHALHKFVMFEMGRINSRDVDVHIKEIEALPAYISILLKEPLGNWIDEGEAKA